MTFEPGDVVTIDFPGVTGIKRRPVVVISTLAYHQSRPDIIVGVLTSQVAKANTVMDYVLVDWSTTGLRQRSAFRSFLATLPADAAQRIGRCSARDWRGIVDCLMRAIALSDITGPSLD